MRLLLIRHPSGSGYTVMDAHCFHMGMPLVGGDIEDLGEHTCIVCPAHRYRIDMKTGCQVEKNLEGHACASKDQKQRVYNVHCDSEFVWVDIPGHPGKEMASDVYNEHHREIMLSQAQSFGGYGIFGPSDATMREVPPGSPLQPYAGHRGWAAGSPLPSALDDPMDLSQPEVQEPSPIKERVPPKRLDFASVRSRETQFGSNSRRRAATAAILKKSYQPPTAGEKKSVPHASVASRQKTLFEAWDTNATSVAK